MYRKLNSRPIRVNEVALRVPTVSIYPQETVPTAVCCTFLRPKNRSGNNQDSCSAARRIQVVYTKRSHPLSFDHELLLLQARTFRLEHKPGWFEL